MTIPECITFLIAKLVQLLSSDLLFPFVGVWLASYVIYLVFHMIGRK